MSTVIHKAATRGHADHGWLESHQSFSFADYYNPERIRFGTLRVLNDDRVDGGKGFGAHPHDNMEIISIPLEGSLVHEDNLGNRRVVGKGEVQVMSTGKGVFHSEYNNSPDQPAKFLQIWVFPNRLNVTPRYDQVKRDPVKEHNQLQPIIAPAPAGTTGTGPNGSLTGSAPTWIYQDAWFQIGRFDKDKTVNYQRHQPGNGIYVFVISGSFRIGGQLLSARDGLGIDDQGPGSLGPDGQDTITATAKDNDSEILIIEAPMHNKIQ